MHIYDLPDSDLYQLKSIDPSLSSNWSNIIKAILPKLNKQGQISAYENILKPKGIYIDENKKLKYKVPETLKSAISKLEGSHQELRSLTANMLQIINSEEKECDILPLSEEIEALLGRFDKISISDSIESKKAYLNIRNAFLYALAKWVDGVDLKISKGLRRLNHHAIKSYFKEVFIKHQIQGREFRSWDSSDYTFKQLTHLPEFIKKEGAQRKFHLVQGERYWFIIGTASKIGENPYSFRRFLYEDSDSGDIRYIYLTHVVFNSEHMNNPKYIKFVAYCMSRLYTLDRGVSQSLIKFINESQQNYQTYLRILFRQNIKNDGTDPETFVQSIMVRFEKQLSILILQKLPDMFKIAENDPNDRDYLFYQMDKLIQQALEDLEDFRLRPLLKYSHSSEIMLAKLISLRVLLLRMNELYSSSSSPEGSANTFHTPLEKVKEELDEAYDYLEELHTLQTNLDKYNHVKENGNLWKKILSGRKPRYTLDEINQMRSQTNRESYMYIIRLAKKRYEGMVYMEFDCNEIINEDFRHYALANGDMGVTLLPKILRLDEGRESFDVTSLSTEVYQDVLKVSSDLTLENMTSIANA